MSGASARVVYFAGLRDAAGVPGEAVEPLGDLGALYDRLRAHHGFAWERAQLRVAVDGAFAGWDDPVAPGSEVVFVPPVSGG